MNVTTPHYLAYVRSSQNGIRGRWSFTLCRCDGAERIEASDVEPKASGVRLDLLAMVRALESLDQPSRVTFVRLRPEIERGIQYGLADWRSNDWRWEWFGQMVPIRNCDLWQRLDRALRFHQVECRRRIDVAHSAPECASKSDALPAIESPKSNPSVPTGDMKNTQQNDWGIRAIVGNWLIYVVLKARRLSRRLAFCIPARRYASAH